MRGGIDVGVRFLTQTAGRKRWPNSLLKKAVGRITVGVSRRVVMSETMAGSRAWWVASLRSLFFNRTVVVESGLTRRVFK